MTPGLFITGTNTAVGKTQISSMIARSLVRGGHRVGVYKPVASGCRWENQELLVADDAQQIWEAAGRPLTLEQACPQRFTAPVSPPLAAQMDGREIDPALLRSGIDAWRGASDIVLVEGAGGLMSPLSENDYNATLAAEFGYPLVIVSVNELGTINATLQTILAARSIAPNLPIAGIVLNRMSLSPNDESTATNADELRRRTDVPLLATVNYGQAELRDEVDWFALGQV